ncbi:hypothetical protein [Anaerovibrio sp. JC8]|uniref:hypothetical protein n=1 Tax=Anaerovibrio sp. JC8 TaxID=1240085 RepID=UPI000A112EA1|nr:hypothetical protein [Anaerovibrio sp. JC8]
MEKPSLIIDGAKIEPAKPKMKVWRAFLASTETNLEETSLETFLEKQIELIIIGFGRPDVVNKESIDENIEIADIVPTVKALFQWIQAETFSKLADLPKND